MLRFPFFKEIFSHIPGLGKSGSQKWFLKTIKENVLIIL